MINAERSKNTNLAALLDACEKQLAAEKDANRGLYIESNERKQALDIAVKALTILRNGANSGLDRKVANAALQKIGGR